MLDQRYAPGRLTSFATVAHGSVAGLHDGRRSTLTMGALDDQVVFHHEYGHERLFTRTVDAALLAVLWTVLDRPDPALSRRIPALRETAQTLMSTSLFAQEAFATYYGVKMVEPAVGTAALGRLPSDYKAYHGAMSSAIDRHFSSTYMQVRVALNVADLVFQSGFVPRFLRDPWRTWRRLPPGEQPSWRMRRLLNDLAGPLGTELGRVVRGWADEFFAERGVGGWDLHDDAGWAGHEVLGYQLDQLLDLRISAWLRHRAGFYVLPNGKRSACLDRLALFGRRLGLETEIVGRSAATVPVLREDLGETIGQLRHDESARTHASKHADSHIANQPLIGRFPALDADALADLGDFARGDRYLVVATGPDEQGDVWFVVRFGPAGAPTNLRLNDESGYAVRVRRADAVAWLHRIPHAPEHSVPVVVVAPFGREQPLILSPWSSQPGPAAAHLDAAHSDRVAQYVTGNWIKFVEAAASLGPVVVTQLLVDITTDSGRPPQPVTVRLALCDGVPGRCFLRILTVHAGLQADMLELDWQAHPSIEVLPTADAVARGLDLDFVASAVNGILAFWSRF
jgi:hypothetical protein